MNAVDTATINTTKQSTNTTNNTITIKYKNATIHLHTPNTFNEHNTTTQLRKQPIRQRALQGRYPRIAQGGMRAKPDMKPWGNANTEVSART